MNVQPFHVGRTGVSLALAVLLIIGSSVAHAGSCTVSSTGLAFGAYQPLTFASKLTSIDVTSTATVSMVCSGITGGGSYTISLGAGAYGGGDRISTRYMNNATNGGDYMIYNIYTVPTYQTVWGNGTIGSLIGGTLPTGDSSPSHTVYGKIPAGQNTLKAGTFSDTVTITLIYNP
jgi:spore coat protein U-like protein